MKQIATEAIVLNRIDYGEADRILTLLTREHGKVSVLAKGVRKSTSKLAGGIELFSTSRISYMPGKGQLATLISTQLNRHYGTIVQHLDRTMLGYELIKALHKSTEEDTGPEYYELLEQLFDALNDPHLRVELVRLWFFMQMLRTAGYTPNLQTDSGGASLSSDKQYNFNFDDMAFVEHIQGNYAADAIKFLRIGFSGNQPQILRQVADVHKYVQPSMNIVQYMVGSYLRT